jgi:hypothetical protein
VPKALALHAAKTALAFAFVTNEGDDDVHGVRLSLLGDEAFEITPPKDAPTTLPPKSSYVWRFEVKGKTDEPLEGKLVFLLEYEKDAVGGSARRSQVEGLEVEVKTSEIPSLEKVAALELVVNKDSITADHPGRANLVISNKSQQQVGVTAVRCRCSGVQAKVVRPTPDEQPSEAKDNLLRVGTLLVAPGGAVVVELELAVDPKGIQPGTRKLLFEVDVAWRNRDAERSGTLVASHDFNRSVLGSEILTLLGVPSFLVLPGFLFLVTMSAAWRLGWRPERKKSDKAFPLPAKQAEFWLVAIAGSFLALPIYRLMGLEYLERYSLNDIVQVWMVSIVAGLLIYLVIVVLVDKWDRHKARWQISERDDPIPLLRKLAKQGLSLNRPAVEWKRGEEVVRGFLAEPQEKLSTGHAWIAPPIAVSVRTHEPTFNERLERALNQVQDVAGLATLLAQAGADAPVAWEKRKFLYRPQHVKSEQISVKARTLIIRRA